MAYVQFLRVRDLSTGHEIDVPESIAADEAAFTVLADYPPNATGQARPAKHRVTKDGQPTTAKPAKRAAAKRKPRANTAPADNTTAATATTTEKE